MYQGDHFYVNTKISSEVLVCTEVAARLNVCIATSHYKYVAM